MNVEKRMMIRDRLLSDGVNALQLVSGKYYTVSTIPDNDGEITIFTNFWVSVPENWFI